MTYPIVAVNDTHIANESPSRLGTQSSPSRLRLPLHLSSHNRSPLPSSCDHRLQSRQRSLCRRRISTTSTWSRGAAARTSTTTIAITIATNAERFVMIARSAMTDTSIVTWMRRSASSIHGSVPDRGAYRGEGAGAGAGEEMTTSRRMISK